LIHCGTQKLKTKTHSNGGKNPKWNEELKLEVNSNDEEVLVEVFDEEGRLLVD
jgi:Ca2+-dependent lipid-binding protein